MTDMYMNTAFLSREEEKAKFAIPEDLVISRLPYFSVRIASFPVG